jgi:hypothetical protein
MLYRDLFESKPPLIFLVAALSLAVSGGNLLYTSVQLLLVGLLGPVLAVFCYVILDRTDRRVRWLVAALALLLGISLGVQAVHRTAGYQTEGFGLLFASVPALCLAVSRGRRGNLGLDLLAGLTLGIAAMFKEPFAPSAVLAMLLFLRSREDLIRLVRIGLVAGLVCLGILVLSRSLTTYLTIDLPEMLSGRSVGTILYTNYQTRLRYFIPTPLWVNSLNAERVLTDLASPWSAACLPLFFFTCMGFWAPLRAKDVRFRAFITSFVILGTAFFCLHYLFIIHQIVSGLESYGAAVPWDDPLLDQLFLIAGLSAAAVLLVLVLAPLLWRVSWKVGVFSVIAVAGLMLASMLVTYGGDYGIAPWYVFFAFPPLLALAVYSLTRAALQERYLILAILGTLIVVHPFLPGQFDYRRFAQSFLPQIQRVEQLRPSALALDTLLSQCHDDRYLFGNYGPYDFGPLVAETRHSPYQIAYGMTRAVGGLGREFSVQGANPYFASKLADDLQHTRVIVLASGSTLATIPPTIAQAIQAQFTATPPPCAKTRVPIDGLQLYFRRS